VTVNNKIGRFFHCVNNDNIKQDVGLESKEKEGF